MNKFKKAESIKTYLEENFEILTNYSKFQESELAKEIRKNAEEVNIFAIEDYIYNLDYRKLELVEHTCISIFEYYCKNCKSTLLEVIELYKNEWRNLHILFRLFFNERPTSVKNSPVLNFIGSIEKSLDDMTELEIDKYLDILFNSDNNIFLYKALITNDKYLFDKTIGLMFELGERTKRKDKGRVICEAFIDIKESYYIYYKEEMLNMLTTMNFLEFLEEFKFNSHSPGSPVDSVELRHINQALQYILASYRYDGETLLKILNIFNYNVNVSATRFVKLLIGSSLCGNNGTLNVMDEVFAEIAHTLKSKNKTSFYFESICDNLVDHAVKRMMDLDAVNGSYGEKNVITTILKMGFMGGIVDNSNFNNYIRRIKIPCAVYNLEPVQDKYYGITNTLSYQIVINVLDFYIVHKEITCSLESLLEELELPVEKLNSCLTPVRLSNFFNLDRGDYADDTSRKYYNKNYLNLVEQKDYINHLAEVLNKDVVINGRDLRRYGRDFITTSKFVREVNQADFFNVKLQLLEEIINKTNNPTFTSESDYVMDAFYEGILQGLVSIDCNETLKGKFIDDLIQLAWKTKTYNELSFVLKRKDYYTAYTFSK